MIEQIAIFLGAAVMLVPLFKKLGLGTILGYLTAGILIGPWCFRFVTDVENILHFSEFGVVLLLFIIGLELQPSRLWVLRRSVFGLGSAQVITSTVVIALFVRTFIPDWTISFLIGVCAALSSTAFVLQTLSERNELTTKYGRESFAILLFQDLAVIPLLVVIPLLSKTANQNTHLNVWADIFLPLIVITLMITLGRMVLRLLFRGVARYGNPDIFTAAALFVVIGTAILMELVGLTMSLGAFLAGVLLADSEFRHQIEAEIEPFKGLLLGLFFIAVGMSVNIGLVQEMPVTLLSSSLLLLTIKFIVLFVIARLTGNDNTEARYLAIMLPAGGEFAFVLLTTAGAVNVIDFSTVEHVIVIITLSMLASPFLLILNDMLSNIWTDQQSEPDYDHIDESGNPVLIIGFGRFGQITARILKMRDIPFTAIDISPTHIDFVRKFGNKVYYGDASRLDLLRAAKVEQARIVLLAISDIETSTKIAELLRQHYPAVPVYARVHNRMHAYKIMDLGIKVLYRDNFLSSLAMAKEVLTGLDIEPAEADRTVNVFREHDEELLKQQHAIYKDEKAMIDSVEKSRAELQSLFNSDSAGTGDS